MATKNVRVPPGPDDGFDTTQDLLNWLEINFRKYGDIYQASVYGSNVYVINGPEYVEQVLLKNWQNYVKGQAIKRVALLLGKGLMVSEGEFWITQRRMVQPAFHRSVIGTLVGVIASANRALTSAWERAARKRQEVNVTRDVSHAVLQIILRSIFGADYEEVAPHFSILTSQPQRSLEFADSFRPLGDRVIEIAGRRRDALPGNVDILGMLMQARGRDGGQAMSDRQLSREIMTLIVAGHETTASVLNWTWYLLSQHPAVDEELSRELETVSGADMSTADDLPRLVYARQVIEETMRLYPPGWLMTRKALEDDRLGDYLVPAGTEIYISPYLIQRHPALWEEPDRFDPERFNAIRSACRHPLAQLPFSAGPRNCIGEFFARIEMQIHLMIVGQRLRMRYLGAKPPEVAAGVNLLSRHDLMMMPELR